MRKNAFWGATFVLGLASAASVQAATFAPNSFVDGVDANLGDGVCATVAAVCTLRAAIQEANGSAGADIINLAKGTYTLTIRGAGENASATGDLDITSDVTINGATPGVAADTVIDAGSASGLIDRVLHITNLGLINVNLNNLTIQSGWEGADSNGGGGLCVQCQGAPNGGGTFPGGPKPAVPTVSLKNVVVQNNYSFVAGGGIANAGALTIEDSIITGNRTPYIPNNISGGQNGQLDGPFIGGGLGGAIANWGGLTTIKRSTISNNWAQTGGAIHNQPMGMGAALVVIEDSRITANQGFLGGAIFNISADWNFPARSLVKHGVVINRSTLDANIAEYAGGAIYNAGFGAVMIVNSTLTANQAQDEVNGNPDYANLGGAIYNSGRIFDILSSTISGNVAEENTIRFINGDEIYLDSSNAGSDPTQTMPFRFTIQNSIVGDTTLSGGQDNNCFGTPGYQAFISSGGNNIDSGNTCGFNKTGDIRTPAILGVAAVLVDNGGLTPTLALLAGSAAINAGNACTGNDQRGLQRVGICDIGAFESGANTPAPTLQTLALTAAADTAVAVAGTPIKINVLANDLYQVASTIRIVSVGPTSANNGSLVLDFNGVLIYTPPPTFTGQDTFTYAINDGTNTSAPATVTVTVVTAANLPPVSFDDNSLTVSWGGTVTGTLKSNNKVGTFSIKTQPTKGVATLTDAASGAFSYTANAAPPTGSIGLPSDFFTFQFNDGTTTSNIGTITIGINPPPLSKPVAAAAVVAVDAGKIVTGSLANAGNGSDVVVYSISVPPTKGTVLLNGSTGSFSYSAAPDATGTDSFKFKITDANASPANSVDFSAENTATISITVPTTPNTQPAVADVGGLTVVAGKSVTGALVGTDANGDKLLYSLASQPSKGSVLTFNPATGAFEYQAAVDATGTETFTYQVTDGTGTSAPATVTINITPKDQTTPVVNLVATDDAVSALTATATVISVLANDQGSGTLQLSSVQTSTANGGVITNNGDGTVTYTSAASFVGVDSFTYDMTDSSGVTARAVVTVTVAAAAANVNPPGNSSAAPVASSGGGGGLLGLEVLLFGLFGLGRRVFRIR